ncbi:MAG: TIGR01906 family membrane protein [Clostridia bacterium]|nr:TIGR01906 family membrane protein [Clostridia bacterium]
MKDKILTGVFAVALAVLILTTSIGLPIYFRPFYYMQINPLDIPEHTGMDYESVKESFDAVLNYLTLPGYEFSTGEFPHSQEGADHFKDCKVLFDLNIVCLISSLLVIVALYILKKKKLFTPCRPYKMHISFSVSAYLLGLFAIIGLLVSLDFSKAFEIFHKIFFPGKTNWVFSSRTDPIILALPQAFFRNCAILIVSSILIQTLSMIIVNLVLKRKRTKEIK